MSKVKSLLYNEDTGTYNSLDDSTCVFCGDTFHDEYDRNNPEPLASEGYCCTKCNYEKVIPARLEEIKKNA